MTASIKLMTASIKLMMASIFDQLITTS